MNREPFDRLFDQAFEEAARHSDFIPDPEPSWILIEKKLAKRARRRRRLRLVPYIVLSFMFGAFIFGTPAVTTAFQPIIETVVVIRDGVAELIVGRQKPADTIPKTAPPPGHVEMQNNPAQGDDRYYGGSMTRQRHETLAEAIEILAFDPPDIRYVGDTFELAELLTYRQRDADKDEQLWLRYDKAGGEEHYTIRVSLFHPGSLMKISSDHTGVATETIAINQYEAYLQVTSEGYAHLQYFVDNLYIAITGLLTREEIVKIGEGLHWG